jgi:uncharacterized membrane protein
LAIDDGADPLSKQRVVVHAQDSYANVIRHIFLLAALRSWFVSPYLALALALIMEQVLLAGKPQTESCAD